IAAGPGGVHVVTGVAVALAVLHRRVGRAGAAAAGRRQTDLGPGAAERRAAGEAELAAARHGRLDHGPEVGGRAEVDREGLVPHPAQVVEARALLVEAGGVVGDAAVGVDAAVVVVVCVGQVLVLGHRGRLGADGQRGVGGVAHVAEPLAGVGGGQ